MLDLNRLQNIGVYFINLNFLKSYLGYNVDVKKRGDLDETQ